MGMVRNAFLWRSRSEAGSGIDSSGPAQNQVWLGLGESPYNGRRKCSVIRAQTTVGVAEARWLRLVGL